MPIPRIVAAGLVFLVTVITPAVGSSEEKPAEVLAPGVEAAFRGTMEIWAYREFWRLWEVSMAESRVTMTQNDFAALMEKGTVRPAAGRQAEDLRVSVTSPQTAMVVAQIGLEDPLTNATQSVVRSFLLYFQDGRWRPQLSDFLGLSPTPSQGNLLLDPSRPSPFPPP